MPKKPSKSLPKTAKLTYLPADQSFLDPLREDRGENC